MIVHIIGRRKSFGKVMEYLAGPGRNGEHIDPRVVAGDRGADVFVGVPMDERGAQLAAAHLDSARLAFQSRVKAPALHIAVGFNEPTTPAQRKAVYEALVDRLGGFDRSAWVAVEHGPSAKRVERGVEKGGHEHGHLVISVVRDDGRAVRLGRTKDRTKAIAPGIERDHKLGVLESRELGIGGGGYSQAEKASAERRFGRGAEPDSDYLRRVVHAASVEAPGERNFVAYLRRYDVTAHPGSRGGYSFSLPGGRRFQGSKLAPNLSWNRIQERWATPGSATADQAAHDAAGRLAGASLRREGRTPGPLAAEARALGRFAQVRAGVSLVVPLVFVQVFKDRIRAAERRAVEAEREQERQYEARRPERSRDHGIGI